MSGVPEGAGVEVDQDGPLLLITLNQPARRNAMTQAAAAKVAAALDRLDGQRDLAVGILTGAGGTFCSGMDLARLSAGESATIPGRGFGGLTERPPSKPLVAAVEGAARGGGFELVLTGAPIGAERAAALGLVNRVVADGDALAEAIALALIVAANAPRALAAAKRVVHESASWPMEDWSARQRRLTDDVFSSRDAAEGVRAFVEKRPAVWTGE